MADLAQAHQDSSVVVTAPILLGARDAARYLGLSKATFYRVVRPEVAPVRVSERRLAFRVTDLDAWAARREVIPHPDRSRPSLPLREEVSA